jgi:hypothetical protein
MEKQKTSSENRRSSDWIEAEERAKTDPELAEKLAVAKRIEERYSEALKRLADS